MRIAEYRMRIGLISVNLIQASSLFLKRIFHFFFAAKKETKQRKNPCREDASTLLGTNAENSVKGSDLCYKLTFRFYFLIKTTYWPLFTK